MTKIGMRFCMVVIVCFASLVFADVRLPAVFSDNMVLQQQNAVNIWGWADPAEKVDVKASWTDSVTSAKADSNGKWIAAVRTPKAGGPFTLTIKGNNEIVLKDVLIGEVWICSGQSNMAYKMGQLKSEIIQKDIQNSINPNIRLFTVDRAFSTTPLNDVKGTWQTCTPETVKDFSATAYYFGRKLSSELNVPIGLVSTNWGGTKAEAWTSPETISKLDQFKQELDRIHQNKAKPNQNTPGVLFNAMLYPLLNMRIAGAIWYQGEANRNDPILYRSIFPTMITDWRKSFNQGDFPFYYVQIAPCHTKANGLNQGVREAQLLTLDKIPNVGMAVTMDIGEEKNIHPVDKWDVGNRLALWALAKTYGKKDIVYSGPLYKAMKIEGDKIRLFFNYVNGGLVAKDGPLTHFTIAGQDKNFVPASAVIDGDSIVVSAQTVNDPVAVRFAWSDWANPNLFNSAGLPASSFRTDDWPITPAQDKQN